MADITKEKGLIELDGYTAKGQIFYTNIKEVILKDETGRPVLDANGSYQLKDRADGKGKEKIRVVVLFHKDDADFKEMKKEVDKLAKEIVDNAKKESGKKLNYIKPYKIHQINNPAYPKDEAEIELNDEKDDDDSTKIPLKINSDYYEMNFETGFIPKIYIQDGEDNKEVPFLDKSAPIFAGSYNPETNLKEGGSTVRILYSFRDSMPEQNDGKLFIQRRLNGIKVLEKPTWWKDDYQPEKRETKKVVLPVD